MVWNLNKPGLCKQDIKFDDHRRTVNAVTFHHEERHWLLSGSQDGSMRKFDIRQREPALVFST